MWLQSLLVCSLAVSGCSNSSSKDSEAPQPQVASEEDAAATGAAAPGEEKVVPEQWLKNLSQVDKITYRFHDASVPPPDHRSFTITATPAQISKKVDSYGELVSESANAITTEQFDALRAMLGKMASSEVRLDAREAACTGGTGNSLRVYVGEQEVYYRHLDACGGSPLSELHGQIKDLGRAAEALLISGADVAKPTR